MVLAGLAFNGDRILVAKEALVPTEPHPQQHRIILHAAKLSFGYITAGKSCFKNYNVKTMKEKQQKNK